MIKDTLLVKLNYQKPREVMCFRHSQLLRTMRRAIAMPRTYLCCLIIVGAFLASCSPPATHVSQTLTPVATYPSDWQSAHDPANAFTIRIPAGWQVTSGEGGTFGNTKLGVSIASIGYRFAPQTSMAVFFNVEVAVYQTRQQHDLICQFPPFPPEQTFHGLPAVVLPDTLQWFIYAQKAYFMVQYYYPGAPVLTHSRPGITPTPLPPAAEIQHDQAILQAILASFTPQPNKPLTCP